MTVTQIPGTEWPDPHPLSEADDPEPFPTDALPTWLGHYIRALSTAVQVPEDMAGLLSLSALSTAVQGKLNVVANSSQWTEIVTLYTATSMSPGQRKSAVFEAVNEPLLDWELTQQDRERAELAVRRQEFKELEQSVERLQAAVQKAASDLSKARRQEQAGPDTIRALEADLQTLRDEEVAARVAFDMAEPVFKTQLVFNDLTPEAAAKALMEQRGHRISVISDEGGVFEVLTGARYSERLNLDIFLKGHSGNLVVVNRVNRDPEYIRRPVITLGLAIQPNVLHEIGKSRQMHGRGLLARFLYAVPESPLGHRLIDSPAVPQEIASEYARNIEQICDSAYAVPAVHTAFLSDAAQGIFHAFQQAIEPRLTPEDGDLSPIAEWASKLNGAVLRIAALIAVARERGMPEEIEEDDMLAAVTFSDYLINHAFRAFRQMGLLENFEQENRTVKRLIQQRIERFTSRDLYRSLTMNRYMSAEAFEDHLLYLERMGYLRRIVESIKPARHSWVVNPKIFEEE